jgi:DNA repair protein RecN (Recombination protein N)
MLRHLDIRDLLIIDRLELAFQPGLNVLTGETGAGKSILLDALWLRSGLAGPRRSGAQQAPARARWWPCSTSRPDHRAHAVLEEAGLPGGAELILRRVNAADGRKTAWVNDRRASGEVLRALSDSLVELHGQQDDRGLLDPRNHARCWMISGVWAHCAGPSRRPGRRAKTLKELEAAEAQLEEMRREEEFLRHAAGEIAGLAPSQGEEAELDARRRLMQAAEKMREDVARAASALSQDGAEGQIGDARRWLDGLADRAEGALDGALAALERAIVELADAQSEVAGFADALASTRRNWKRRRSGCSPCGALRASTGSCPTIWNGSARIWRRVWPRLTEALTRSRGWRRRTRTRSRRGAMLPTS